MMEETCSSAEVEKHLNEISRIAKRIDSAKTAAQCRGAEKELEAFAERVRPQRHLWEHYVLAVRLLREKIAYKIAACKTAGKSG